MWTVFDSIPDPFMKPIILIGLIGICVVAGWGVLLAMKIRRASARKAFEGSERNYADYMAYLRIHIATVDELPTPYGKLSETDRNYLTHELTEWMARIRGEEHGKLLALSGRLGLVERELKRLGHGLSDRRLDAAHRLGFMRAPQALEPLCGLIAQAGRKADAFVFAQAAACCATRAEDVERIVLELSRDHGDATRLTAELIREADADPAVVTRRLIGSGNPALIRVALIGLPTMVDPHVGRDVARLTETGDKEMRLNAIRAFVQSGTLQPERVRSLLRDPDWEVRMEAVRELGGLGESSAVPLIAATIEDGHDRVREQGVRSLALLQEGGVRALGAGGDEPEEVLRHNTLLYAYRKYGKRQAEVKTG
ncbi:HEAT repeat domain-containing protein [Paenibacillus hodogayensis]|uniref:HEAT repeat domain-containing protein n=1 Tax=Paenibacillus hodogayensis TaxID=279208 RepID=A0ABV5VZW6_9BACL